MKLQHLDLGHGTSQHVLISGKTGSGKSTLLHVLITNLALRYSPDEVELYLVDFKKGVEFKAYARSLLPHARVIAIESEREFGLSVLQRLDAELRTRGDMFRKRGTQDVKAYRAIEPDAIAAANPADYRRIPGTVRRGRPDRARVGAIARPARASGPGVRNPRAARLADARRGVHAGPQHDRANGRAHCVAVQRGRLASDPQRRQHRRPAADPARRSDLQRRQRTVRRQPPLPDRLVGRPSARRLSATHQPTRPPAARRPAAADRLRGQRAGRPGRQSDLEGIDRVAPVAGNVAGRPGVARLGRGHQGSDRGGVLASERQQRVDGRASRGGGAGRLGKLLHQLGRSTRTGWKRRGEGDGGGCRQHVFHASRRLPTTSSVPFKSRPAPPPRSTSSTA